MPAWHPPVAFCSMFPCPLRFAGSFFCFLGWRLAVSSFLLSLLLVLPTFCLPLALCFFAVCFPRSLCLEPPDPTRTLFASPTNPSPSSQVHFFSGSGYLIKNETVFCNSELFCFKSKTDWDILNGF